MTGETNLGELLASMSPAMIDGEFVFCTFAAAGYGDHARLEPVAAVSESEGLTLVVPRAKADEHRLDYDSVFRGITLAVHSSLEAVGLTAAFSGKLAEHDISANVIAGFYHDHIFVPADDADKAMSALAELVRRTPAD
jgi:hypothetical protein